MALPSNTVEDVVVSLPLHSLDVPVETLSLPGSLPVPSAPPLAMYPAPLLAIEEKVADERLLQAPTAGNVVFRLLSPKSIMCMVVVYNTITPHIGPLQPRVLYFHPPPPPFHEPPPPPPLVLSQGSITHSPRYSALPSSALRLTLPYLYVSVDHVIIPVPTLLPPR